MVVFQTIDQRTEEKPEFVEGEESSKTEEGSIDAVVAKEPTPKIEGEDPDYSGEEHQIVDPNAGKYGPGMESSASDIQYGVVGQNAPEPGYRSQASPANPGYH